MSYRLRILQKTMLAWMAERKWVNQSRAILTIGFIQSYDGGFCWHLKNDVAYLGVFKYAESKFHTYFMMWWTILEIFWQE